MQQHKIKEINSSILCSACQEEQLLTRELLLTLRYQQWLPQIIITNVFAINGPPAVFSSIVTMASVQLDQ